MPHDPRLTFTLIGSGAVRANPRRGGTAQLLRINDRPLLIDCGRSAVHGLARAGVQPEELERVLISHLHFDHICDLAQLMLLRWNNGAAGPLPMIGPEGLKHFLDQGVRGAYVHDIDSRLGHGKDPAGLAWDVLEVNEPGPLVQAEDYQISGLFTEHADMSNLNYRIDVGPVRVAVLSDSAPDTALTAFCAGADLLVCECSGTRAFLNERPWGHWHMDPDAVAELASAAGVGRVVLKHLVIEDWVEDPSICEKMAQQVRKGFDGEVMVGEDGLRIDLTVSRQPSVASNQQDGKGRS